MIAAVANHLWQSTLFALGVALLAIVCRSNQARVRHALWLSASLKFLVPFALLMSVGSHLLSAPDARKMAPPAVTVRIAQLSEPFDDLSTFRAQPTPSDPRTFDWVQLALLAVWASGCGVIALGRWRTWLSIRAAVRASARVTLPDVRSMPVDARAVPGLLEPGVIGFIHPVLLVPADLEQHLTAKQLESVVAHELCHIRRRDNVTAAMHMLVEAVFWFHPLVWWIGARLMEERERACDEHVLHVCAEPQAYAEGILNVCKRYVDAPLACMSGVGGADLRRRIEAIMANRIGARLSAVRRLALAAAAIAAVALPLAVGALTGPPLGAQTQSPTGARRSFEADSIKPNRSGDAIGLVNVALPGGRVTATNTLLRLIIAAAYQPGFPPRRSQMSLVGLPDWDESEHFDLEAKADGNPTVDDKRAMLQSLLADRFKLVLHRETRPGPVFALMMATDGRRGPQLQPHSPTSKCTDPSEPPPPRAAPGAVPPAPPPPPCGGIRALSAFWGRSMTTRMAANGVTMQALAERLTWFQDVDRTVIDKTGLAGAFDLTVEWTPTFQPPPAGSSSATDPVGADASGPPVESTALAEQLGLKLQREMGPIEVLDRR